MTPDLTKFTEKTPVLDQGFVRLVDVMGGDGSVVEAARVTTGKGRSQHAWVEWKSAGATGMVCTVCNRGRVWNPETDEWCFDDHCLEGDRRLIRFMLRHAHWSPFEFAEMTIHLRIPMDAWRQLVRHWSLSVQEYSTRYSPAINATAATAPDAWRAQGGSNRQGSAGVVSTWPEGWHVDDGLVMRDAGDHMELVKDIGSGVDTPGDYLSAREQQLHTLARDVYEERLVFNVAREQARKDLPLSTYTEVYLKGNLRDWLNMLAQRLDPHAQHEIRQYALAVAEIVRAWCPLAWEAFVDYRLEARTFSRQQVAAVKTMIVGWARRVQAEAEARGVEGPCEVDHVDHALSAAGVPESERREFLKALGLA